MSHKRPKDAIVGRRFWEAVTKEYEVTKAEIRYFGLVKRIPAAAFPKKIEELPAVTMEWDESAESMRRDFPASLPVSMQGWEPIPTGSIERYEAFDRETGDLLVFWRVPCRRKG
jgi:hypothetical protein